MSNKKPKKDVRSGGRSEITYQENIDERANRNPTEPNVKKLELQVP